MNLPSSLQWNVAGIKTRPHDDPKRPGYLVYVPTHRVWMAAEDALRGGLVSMPPPLPSGLPHGEDHRAACAEYYNQHQRRNHRV